MLDVAIKSRNPTVNWLHLQPTTEWNIAECSTTTLVKMSFGHLKIFNESETKGEWRTISHSLMDLLIAYKAWVNYTLFKLGSMLDPSWIHLQFKSCDLLECDVLAEQEGAPATRLATASRVQPATALSEPLKALTANVLLLVLLLVCGCQCYCYINRAHLPLFTHKSCVAPSARTPQSIGQLVGSALSFSLKWSIESDFVNYES